MAIYSVPANAGNSGGALAGIEHNALFYDGLGEYLTTTAPFLRAGLEAENVMLAVVPEPRLSALRDTMGRDGEGMAFVDANIFYQHPVRTIKEYDKTVRQFAPRRLRVVAEPIWAGRGAAETVEWARYESLVNVAFANSGAHVICAYDRKVVTPEVIEHARRTHPQLIDGPAEYRSRDYREPEVFGADCDRGGRTPPPEDAEYLPFAGDRDLRAVRAFVRERAVRLGLPEPSVRDMLTAVTEVATNALRHGTPPMGVRVWSVAGEFVCEVSDHGFWQPGALTGFVPPESALQTGFGLWTVRLLVDVVRLHTGFDGTFVRLHVHR